MTSKILNSKEFLEMDKHFKSLFCCYRSFHENEISDNKVEWIWRNEAELSKDDFNVIVTFSKPKYARKITMTYFINVKGFQHDSKEFTSVEAIQEALAPILKELIV